MVVSQWLNAADTPIAMDLKVNLIYISTHIPLRPGVLLSVDLWDITQNRLLTSTDS